MIFVFFQSLGGLFPDTKSETADVVQEINTYFTGLHGILQAREKQLTREVYDAFKAGDRYDRFHCIYTMKLVFKQSV
jgi:hypothetical protein